MTIKVFNNLKEIKKYYNKKTNTYDFRSKKGNFIEKVILNFDLNVESDIITCELYVKPANFGCLHVTNRSELKNGIKFPMIKSLSEAKFDMIVTVYSILIGLGANKLKLGVFELPDFIISLCKLETLSGSRDIPVLE